MHLKIGIKFKLVSFITALLIFVITLLSFLVLNGIQAYQKKKDESILLNQKNMFEQYLSQELSSSYYEDTQVDKNFHLNNANMFNKSWLNSIPASIYDIKGNLIYSYEKDEKWDLIQKNAEMIRYALNNKIAYTESNNNIYYYSPLKYKSLTAAVLRLKYSVKENNDFYSNIKRLFVILGLISLLIGIILGIIYFIPFTNDIQKMIYSVNNIRNGNFNDIKEIKRKDELGELSRGIVFMSNTIGGNIIELQKEKNTLCKAVDKLERLGEQQKIFIGNVTHEFKTPLTSIKAYADILQMYEYDPDLNKEASLNISKECERLCQMIDNVLRLSSLEKYDFEIKKNKISLKPIIEQICSRMMGKIIKNKLKLECNLEDMTILGDEEGIKHILINLVDNAIKYNIPGGSINITEYTLENESFIEISDTGIGISHDDLNRIFEPFYRVHSDRSRKSGGTGLGLPFVKKMLEMQGARISVSSEVNIGSKFTIIFPTVS